MAYLDIDGIKQAFAEHMKKYRGYSDEEAAMAVSDFPDPYENCYLREEYIKDCEVDGVSYEKNASFTAFWRIGLDDVPMFRFYTYYRSEDIEGHTVGEYMKARKLFQVDDLDCSDFPKDSAKTRSFDFEVTLCLGGGDGGDVLVNVDVTEEEYELLKKCYRDDIGVCDCDGLEDLCQRVEEAAKDENEFCMADLDVDEEIDYNSISYMISIPAEVAEEVDEEDSGEE